MQNRIDRLEGLVLSLMTNGAQSAGPAAASAAISRSMSDSTGTAAFPHDPDQDDDEMRKEEDDEDSDVDSVNNSFGVLKVDNQNHKSMYVGDSHWHLVLADITEVKNYFATHKKELENQYSKVKSTKPASLLDMPALLSSTTPATEAELRAKLPSRLVVDKLVNRFFSWLEPTVYVVHASTFRIELSNHWQDPSKTSLVWLGMLYGVLCLSHQSYHKANEEPPEFQGRTLDLAGEYRLRAVQCLKLADFTRSADYTIEALCLYLWCEFNNRSDSEVGIWTAVGMIVRLAMRMGYHRDPKNFLAISPFAGEMRRRVWHFIRSMDIMSSFQLALPSMIKAGDCDTQAPRNIYEDEFGPDSKELPPPRPATEPTAISYMLTKAQISFEFGGIVEELNAVSGRAVSYDDVLRHDNRLRDIRTGFPPHLQLQPLELCQQDPTPLLMQRYQLEIFYHKALCVLHRKYIMRARQNPRYAHSRRTCVDSSMDILRHQAKIYVACQAGGRLNSVKWHVASLSSHDFLLAAMIVCLDLHYDSLAEQRPPSQTTYDMYFWTSEQRADMLRALEGSYVIWNEYKDASIEAYKASQILGIMLDKIKSPPKSRALPGEAPAKPETFAGFDQDNLQPEHSAAMTLGMLSSGGLNSHSPNMFGAPAATAPEGPKWGNINMHVSDPSAGAVLPANYAMDPSLYGAGASAPSSFPTFNNNGPVNGLVDVPENLDWVGFPYIPRSHRD